MNNQTQPVRVAISGCGAISQLYYAPALTAIAQLGQVKVQALFDPNKGRAAYLQQTFPNAQLVESISHLSGADIDLAIVASPNRYHSEQTCELLSSGISVLCEKPIATSVKDAEAMIEQAAASKRLLAIGLVRRFFPAAQAVRQIILSGVLGSAHSFSIREGGPSSWAFQSSALFDRTTSGGGILLDIGSHLLDLVCWWFGEPSKLTYADDAMGGLEANCSIEMAFGDGLSGTVRLSRDWTLPNKYTIEFDRGWTTWQVGQSNQLELGFHAVDFELSGRLRNKLDKQLAESPGTDFEKCFVRQLMNVIAAVRHEEELLIPGQEGIRSLKLIERCYQSRSLIEMPWLSERERASAQFLNSQGAEC